MDSPENVPFPKQAMPPPPPSRQAAAPASQSGTPAPGAEHITKADSDVLRQLRILEDRYVNLRRKAQLTDENLLSQQKHVQKEIHSLTDELTEMRRQLAGVTQGLQSVQGEIAHCATIYDVKAIEKYLQFWEPLWFVTQTELVRRRNLLKEPAGKELYGAR